MTAKTWYGWQVLMFRHDKADDIYYWCYNNLDSENHGRYYIGNDLAFFEYEEDAIWFRMVWE